ncbi:unnamed protein product [Brassicogethes aeneus]|uniref:Uncharacterized protein n=1 Tax=Brassicogethes aeneus TaxID=1431903 RepID=A0A9P0AXT5_BRAAE|nr:unnamed protein product [Brassicogethes aeneus]
MVVYVRYPDSYWLSEWQRPNYYYSQYIRPTRFTRLYAPTYWAPSTTYTRRYYYDDDIIPISTRIRYRSRPQVLQNFVDDMALLSYKKDDAVKMVLVRYPISYYSSLWREPDYYNYYYRPLRWYRNYWPLYWYSSSYWPSWRSYYRYLLDDYWPSSYRYRSSNWAYRLSSFIDDMALYSRKNDTEVRP